MAIAAIFNVPGDESERSEWAFAHMANHRDIIRVVYERYSLALPEYALDPLPVNDMGTWERLHQEMHSQLNGLLGLAGFNLLGIDWRNQGELAGWISLNATEHRQFCDFLQIG